MHCNGGIVKEIAHCPEHLLEQGLLCRLESIGKVCQDLIQRREREREREKDLAKHYDLSERQVKSEFLDSFSLSLRVSRFKEQKSVKRPCEYSAQIFPEIGDYLGSF